METHLKIIQEGLEGAGYFKIGQLLRIVKYADHFVILAKEQTVL